MINSDYCHDLLMKNNRPLLRYDECADYKVWKKNVFDRYRQLLGLDEIEKNSAPQKFKIEYTQNKGNYTETRFLFDSEAGCTVPCYILIPNGACEKYPVAICLQGHSTGFHNSVGKTKYDGDAEYINTRGDFGIQAVNNGYIALCIEQRGMGERKPAISYRFADRGCDFIAHNALLLGRTLIGERVWDISKAIDVLSYFEKADIGKIFITGNSGGGTASYYAACYDKRIKLCVPSCAICSFERSISETYHCSCNYIPGMYKYFDMGELACLIAPRPLIIFTGEKDEIFLFDGVKKVYTVIENIYRKENAVQNCKLVVTPYGHYWDKERIWQYINDKVKEGI